MSEFGILLYPGIRAKLYLEALLNEGCKPSFCLLLSNGNDVSNKIAELCTDLNLITIRTDNINSNGVKDILKEANEEYFIFTGGGILDEEMVKLKKFIHVHPGILPEYKGSTCLYYSLLEDNTIGATSFLMSAKIDEGDIIAQKYFNIPQTLDIDYYYEPYIRAQLLVYVMKNRLYLKTQPQPSAGRMYYVIHPALKHVALVSLEVTNSQNRSR